MDKNKIFYHHNLLNRKLRIIKKFRCLEQIEANEIVVTNTYKTEQIENDSSNHDFKQINLPYKYGGIDDYMWTKATFNDLDQDKVYYGEFDFGTGSGGLTCGAETLLYINSKEHSGVDLNHREIYLGKLNANAQLSFRTWSGIADESRLEELEYIQGIKELGNLHVLSCLKLFVLDEKVNNLYYNVFAMLESYSALKESNVTAASRIINDLSHTLLHYDEHDLTREKLYELDAKVQMIIDGYDDKSLIQMIAVGQTHIDLAWLWRIKHTREKAARSFSTMLNLMETNEQFTFLQSQPQIFDFLKQDYPQVYKKMKETVKNGRLEIDGAMWLESDCNIPNAESMIRQIMYGKRFIKDEFGLDSKLLWMPDVFGYSWAMPQILKKSGVDTFCTTKMQWNQYNRMPFNTFKWRGIDGSEIVTHLIEDFSFFTINAKSMLTGTEKYRDKDLTNEVLYQYGFGDGGGGPRQEDIELVKRFDKIPGLPNIKYDTASNYFARLNKSVLDPTKYAHTWDGEMYLELHRGTFTSQARMKKLNRMLEYKLRYIEMLIVKAKQDQTLQKDYKNQLLASWKDLMLNQFHDIIPGSSINQVYDDAEITYASCLEKLQSIETEIVSNYELLDEDFVVFNSYHQKVDNEVFYQTEKSCQFSIDGQRIDASQVDGGYIVYASNLKPLAFTKINVCPSSSEAKMQVTNELKFSTNFYDVEINEIGQITKLYDKELNKQLLVNGNVFNKLVSYEDRPLNWDAWDIDIFYDKRERVVDDVKNHIVTYDKHRIVIEFNYEHFNSKIQQQIVLSNKTKRIDITHNVDYKDDHRLLRVLFETDIRATEARFDIQAGNALRPTHRNTSWDMQKFEVLGHRWADISNNAYGISILNNCKYGYSAKDSTIGLTLIKAGQFPDKKQDITNHNYTYSIYPHAYDVLASNIDVVSHTLNEPLTVIKRDIDNKSIVSIENDNVYVDAIKLAEDSDDVVVRIHEWRNSESPLKINQHTISLDLLENECDEDNQYIKNYEIKTLKLK